MTQATIGESPITWPNADYTRTPYEVYTSEEIFAREQRMIFNGPTWVILGLECEVAEPGSYTRSTVGTTPVVLSRSDDGELYAFVNKCAHRGAQVVRELRGKKLSHTCLYHGWTYDTKGDLKVAPLAKGVMGQGGYPGEFKVEDHCLQKLKVDTFSGIVFGSLHENPPSLRDYLGDAVAERLSMICNRPLKVWGYQRQTMACNWKLFMENTRDMYHAPMLHSFIPKFGMFNPAKQKNSLKFGLDGGHGAFTTYDITGVAGAAKGVIGKIAAPMMQKKMMAGTDKSTDKLVMEDPSVAQGVGELPDGTYLNIISIFPATLFTIVANTLSFRQIRPIAPDKCETVYTWFQYEDDDEEMHHRRVEQSNLFGPAGFVAMEDAEVMETTQIGIARGMETGESFMEMGGLTIEDGAHGITEASVRGFWKAYCRYMEIPVNGQQAAAE